MPSKELKKILLVEDEDDIKVIAQFALEVLGKFEVKYGSSGLEAIPIAEEFKPDLILLDMMMPGMDGVATLKALRDHPELSKIPVIFMTAKVQTNEITQYKEMGVLDVIAKPFDPMTLAERLRTIWSKTEEVAT